MEQQAEQMSHNLIDAIQSDRKSLMGKDLFRSFILIAIAALLIALYLKKKIISANFSRRIDRLNGLRFAGSCIAVLEFG